MREAKSKGVTNGDGAGERRATIAVRRLVRSFDPLAGDVRSLRPCASAGVRPCAPAHRRVCAGRGACRMPTVATSLGGARAREYPVAPPPGDYGASVPGSPVGDRNDPHIGVTLVEKVLRRRRDGYSRCWSSSSRVGKSCWSVSLVCRMPVRSVEKSSGSICPSGWACGLRRGVWAARQNPSSVREHSDRSSPGVARYAPLPRRDMPGFSAPTAI